MQVKALRGFYGADGSVRRHQVIEVTDYRAAALMKRGLVVEVQGGEEVPAGAADPSRKRQAGGRTGAAKSPSSSPADRPQRTSRSTSSKDGRGS